MPGLVALLAVVAIVCVGLALRTARRNRVPSALLGRAEQSIEEIFRDGFAGRGVSFEEFQSMWQEMAECFCVPPGLMRPGDRFGVELPCRPVFGMTEEDMILARLFAARLVRHGRSPTPANPPATVEEYVLAFSIRGSSDVSKD